MNEIIILVLSIILLIAFFKLAKPAKYKKVPIKQTKEDLINQYKERVTVALKDLDSETRIQRKKEILKEINQELARNIYFEANELKSLMVTLASL